MPNRTFEVSVQENKANTVIYDLEVWVLFEHQTELWKCVFHSSANQLLDYYLIILQSVEQYFNVSDPVFEIVQGDEINKFSINQTSKELRVGSQALDREQRAQHTVIIELLSNGINRGFARVCFINFIINFS